MAERTLGYSDALVRLSEGEAPAKRTVARQIVVQCARRGSLYGSAQGVCGESSVIVSRKLERQMSPNALHEAMGELARLPFGAMNRAVVLALVAKSEERTLVFVDGLIVEAARARGRAEVSTECLRCGREFGSVTIRNSFRSAQGA